MNDLRVEKRTTSNSNELDLEVQAPKEIAEKAYSVALRNAANSVEIAGFRKGKAPKDVLEKKLGRGYISQKAFEGVFYDILNDVSIQEKLDIVDIVQITSFELLPENPLKFKVTVEIRPEVNLGKYKGLKVKAKKLVYDKNIFIEKTLEKIANNLMTFNKVTDRSVQTGDQIVIDFEGKFEDGIDVPGGKAENFQAMLEKDKFLPEFVEKLQGTKIGETKEISIVFPENYSQGFSGKKAIFKVKLNSIEEKIVPEINDELAKKVGSESLKSLKERIEKQMIEIQDRNSHVDFENKIVDEIIKNSKYEISNRMIAKEIDFLLSDVKNQCQKTGVDWSEFKNNEKNKELLEKARESAIKRISIDLVLSALIKKEKIIAPKEDIENEVKNQMLQLGEYKHLENNVRFISAVELNVLRNKAVDFLVNNNEPMWEEELVKEPN